MMFFIMLAIIVCYVLCIIFAQILFAYMAYKFGKYMERRRQKKIECAERMKHGIPRE